jgi:WD40 repeat protein
VDHFVGAGPREPLRRRGAHRLEQAHRRAPGSRVVTVGPPDIQTPAHGWLYFGSNRPGGFGATDIWRARLDTAGGWAVENLGAAVNTPGDDYEPLPAPEGSRMILMADGGLYETRKTRGWAPRTKLGPEVNQNGTEIGPLFSPSGRSLLFARDTRGPESGEFFVWYEHGREEWPPDCPGRGR